MKVILKLSVKGSGLTVYMRVVPVFVIFTNIQLGIAQHRFFRTLLTGNTGILATSRK